MRLARLLLIVVLVLIAGRSAASQDNKTDNRKPNVQPELTNPPEPSSHNNNPRAHILSRYPAPDLLADNNTCLVMHTTQVARDGLYTDATHVVAERDCTPANRFQMKSAVATPAPQK
jgi:hypothetical protein